LIESIVIFLESILGATGWGRHALVFLLSMFPAISGPAIAIPIGAAMGLPPLTNAIASAAGNIFPVPFIIFFIRKIFAWMRKTSKTLGKIADSLENRAKARAARRNWSADNKNEQTAPNGTLTKHSDVPTMPNGDFTESSDALAAPAGAKGGRFRYGAFFGLLLFVAVPLPIPGTGAWTGAMIATIINVRFKIAMPAIALGIIISSVIATVVTYGLMTWI
jgi:uncharacterized membrane protein